MIPFISEYYFYVLFALTIPAIILGLIEKPLKYYGFFVTLVFVALVYNTGESLLRLGIFFVFSLLTAKVYSWLKNKNGIAFWFFLTLALSPLIAAKIAPGFTWVRFLGLSYITFRTVQFVLGIKENKITKVKSFAFSYFVLFFPAISSGPIDRYKRFETDLAAVYSRAEYLELLREGIWKIFNGLLYCFVIAPVVNEYLLSYFGGGQGFIDYAGYAYSYTLYLFFNFAGYSKLAIGASYIFGVKMPENFNMPFVSKDIKEFWTRWHMSLSTFFRDTVYNKFVFASLKRKWFKYPRLGSYIGYALTMLVMGVWHGLDLHFIAYGVYHGLFLCANDWLDANLKGFKKFKNTKHGGLICMFVTWHIVAFGMLIFSGKIF